MFSDKKGFLLPEILLSVLIVSLTAVLVVSAASSHLRTAEIIREESREMEETERSVMRGVVRCGCGSAQEEQETDSS